MNSCQIQLCKTHFTKTTSSPSSRHRLRLVEVSGINDPERFSFILSEKYSALAIGSDKFVATLACDISQAPGGAEG